MSEMSGQAQPIDGVAEPPSAPAVPCSPAITLAGHALRWATVIWITAITLFFHHQEGFLPLSFLYGESMRPGLTRTIFHQALTQPWRIAGEIPWGGIAAGFGMSVAATLLGMTMIRFTSLRRLHWWEQASLGFGLGVGLVGIGTSLLAMAGLLSRWPVALLWLALTGLATGLFLRNRSQLPSVPDENEPSPTVTPPDSWGARVFRVLGWTLIALITLLTFIHGVAQRETYWDSLILYMGYARMMVEEGGVIRRVVGQVGIGLGANYPHLFEFFAAQTAALVGRWDDQHAQWMAPVAGLAATLLIYGTVVRASGGNRCAGVAAALCFRAYPSSLIYTQYATPYALGILAVAALLFLATVHHHHRDRASLIGMLTVSAIACHINFLMIVLFPVAIIAILFTPSAEDAAGQIRPLVRLQQLALPLIACLILASPWFIRNWIVTGNPVYAFFPGIFGGIHINPDVMESAVAEWRANGDGLHVLGPTLADKIRGLPAYFVTGSQAWKTAPVLVAWSLPGFILSLIMLVVGVLALARRRTAETGWPLPVLFLLSSLFTGLWAYAFVVADYYLYQIVPVSAVIGVLAGYLWTWLGQAGRGVRTILSVVALGTGLVPGTSMGLMGFKLKTSSQQVPSPQIQVVAARNLFLPPERIYRLEYGADMDAFAWLNRLPRNSVVLTHENRHLLHRPDLHIVHLDDWEPQQVYGQDPDTRQRALDQLGIRWYLYVPNEDRHRVNARLGMAELIRLGYWEEVQRSRASRASFPDSPANAPDSPIAADHNVLFRRTELQPAKPPAP